MGIIIYLVGLKHVHPSWMFYPYRCDTVEKVTLWEIETQG